MLRDYEKAWEGRDPAGLAALFAEDGFVLASNRPPVRGREAIRAAYAGAGGPLVLRALAWSTEGPVGYIIGAFGRVKGGEDDGKFVLALRRDAGGRWLIAADMDNSNRRPAPARRRPRPRPDEPARSDLRRRRAARGARPRRRPPRSAAAAPAGGWDVIVVGAGVFEEPGPRGTSGGSGSASCCSTRPARPTPAPPRAANRG